MDNNTKLLVGGVAAAVAGFALYKYMTKKKASSSSDASFTADEQHFMNYVDESFMGMHGTTDDLLMVGGCKPVEFANASSHNPPLATDEPNFANSDGFDYLGGPKRKALRKRKQIAKSPVAPPPNPASFLRRDV
jgi:hypothetical protein